MPTQKKDKKRSVILTDDTRHNQNPAIRDASLLTPFDLLLDIGWSLGQNESSSQLETPQVKKKQNNINETSSNKKKKANPDFNEKIALTLRHAKSNEIKTIINSLTVDGMNKKEVKENMEIEIDIVKKITGFFWKQKSNLTNSDSAVLAVRGALTVMKIINDKATLAPNTADKHKVHQLTSSLDKKSKGVTDDFTKVKSKHKTRKTLNHRKREKKYEKRCYEHGGVLIVSLLTQVLRCHNWRDQNMQKNELTLSIMPLYCLIKESNLKEVFNYIERVNQTSRERKKTDDLSRPKSFPLKRNEKKHRALYTDMVLFCKAMTSIIKSEVSPKSVAQLDQKRSAVRPASNLLSIAVSGS